MALRQARARRPRPRLLSGSSAARRPVHSGRCTSGRSASDVSVPAAALPAKPFIDALLRVFTE
ncbi:hypothetical protein AB0F03_19890 [Streptomyces sp. NPDC028722]|uniref:hypothetical protein n=1 Tax=Streptomyces sp. NPDC028722 TaxID=3155016 RepID=UPI0033EA7EBC